MWLPLFIASLLYAQRSVMPESFLHPEVVTVGTPCACICYRRLSHGVYCARYSCVILIFKVLFAVFSFTLLKWHKVWVLGKAGVQAALLNVGEQSKQVGSLKAAGCATDFYFHKVSFPLCLSAFLLLSDWNIWVMIDGIRFVSLFSSKPIKCFIYLGLFMKQNITMA